MNSLTQKIFTEAAVKRGLKILLGLVFVAAGMFKLFAPGDLTKEIAKLTFLGSTVPFIITYLLIAFELALGFLLIFRYSNKVLVVTLVSILVFAFYLSYKVITHDASTCGCMGNFLHRSNMQALVQDVFLLMAGVYLYE